MDHGTQINLGGAIVMRARNLRAMRDYARVSRVAKVESWECERETGRMLVTYANGATCQGEFRSYHIMVDFIRNRRTWRNAEHVMHGPDMGYLTRPGVIAGA